MCKCISLASQTISVCIRASVDALCRDGTDMRGDTNQLAELVCA